MTLAVLKAKDDIVQSRALLKRRGLSTVPQPWLESLMRRLRLGRFLIGDNVKSWDVLRTASFLEDKLPKDSKIVDFGAYQSEILAILHRMGFSHLYGIDLNPRMERGVYCDAIRYTVGDFLQAPYESGSFSAITSISAIEHGLDVPRLIAEVSRLLRSGGYFVCSTDYWPDKIDTIGLSVLGMSWNIFSADELRDVMNVARQHGLHPVGAIDFNAAKPVIHYHGKDYTFAWFALRKE